MIVVPVFFFQGLSFSTLLLGLAALEALGPDETVAPHLGLEAVRRGR